MQREQAITLCLTQLDVNAFIERLASFESFRAAYNMLDLRLRDRLPGAFDDLCKL